MVTDSAPTRRDHGRALLVLGLLAMVRAHGCAGDGLRPPMEVGAAVPLALETLAGDGFRLLPGVGPVLAERLETARRAAGGVLTAEAARSVRGVGPVLLKRWRSLRSR